MKIIKIYDTTLRDGTQGEGVSFSVEDKVRIAQTLDAFGVHYVEGGWPGSNPKDIRFFKRIIDVPLKHTKIAAFGSTRRAGIEASADGNINALLEAKTPVVTIFGKSWDFHVTHALNTTLEENLRMISDSIKYVKPKVEEVIYDAEHFFDGFKKNREYAISTIRTAQEARADCIVLCDTNGGTLPHEVIDILKEVKNHINIPLGIHAHNDAEMGVANSITAVMGGVVHVQGTINGYGERCGNANLCSIIPNIALKLKLKCIPDEKLKELREISRLVSELSNLKPWQHQPFVGDSAFAHKGGIHVSAVMKNPETYEHIKPELVGNHRRVLISELSGKSNIFYKAAEFGIDLTKESPHSQQILELLKELENQGFQFEGAEASFELLMEKALGLYRNYFDLESFRVTVEKRQSDKEPLSEATIKVKVKGIMEHTASEGNGPVNALDNAMRKALEEFYPNLKEMQLLDYKVRILEGSEGTAAKTRVLITSGDNGDTWGTVGLSTNIIEASWQALVDSIEYKLRKDEKIQGK